METLSYLHLAATYESPVALESEMYRNYSVFFRELDWLKWPSRALIPLIFFAIALTSLSFSTPALALNKGDRSSQVTSLQKKLQSAGYFSGPATGYYGPLTQKAVMQFQKARGLTPDGVAGSETLEALESASGTTDSLQALGASAGASLRSQPLQSSVRTPATPESAASPQSVSEENQGKPRLTVALQKGSNNSQVSSLQQKLQAAGYFKSPITGYYGTATEAAVKQFQKVNGLTANGIADEETLKAIELSPLSSKLPEKTIPPSVAINDSKVEIPGNLNPPQAAPEKSQPPIALKKTSPQQQVTTNSKVEIPGNLNPLQTAPEKPQTPIAPEKTSPQQQVTTNSKVEIAGNLNPPQTTPEKPQIPTTSKKPNLQQEVTTNSKVEIAGNLNLPQTAPEKPQIPTTSKKPNLQQEVTTNSKVEIAGNLNLPQTAPEKPQTPIALKKPNLQQEVTTNSKVEIAGNLNLPPAAPEKPQILITSKKPSPQQQVTTNSKVEIAGNFNLPQTAPEKPQTPTTPKKLNPQQLVTNKPKESSLPAATLKKGVNNSQVTSLQQKLQAAGFFAGPVTGYYGSLTEAAVMKFQKAQGLTANGMVDQKTLNALESSARVSPSSQTLQSSAGVSAPSKTLESNPKVSAPSPVLESNAGLLRLSKALELSVGKAVSSQSTAFQNIASNQSKVAPSSTAALQKGNTSTQVTSLQKKLQAAGYFQGPVTGYYGSLTEAAVMKFQKAHGLTANGMADQNMIKVLEAKTQVSAPQKNATSSENTNNLAVENPVNLNTPEQSKLNPQTSNTVKTTDLNPEVTAESKEASSSDFNKPQEKSPIAPTRMKLKKTISGKISPKSVVHSEAGLFFAQNMMYNHTITVYDREHNLVKTIPDAVDLSKYGYSKFKGNYKGAPVEADFSHNGKYAWVSNYKMYGLGFNNPGTDVCSPSQKTDRSFLYRINTDTLKIDKVIQVGSVPKYVATSPDNRLVLVSNWCSWDVSVVETEKNQEIKRIKLGRYPRGIVVDSTSEIAYVAVMGSRDIAKVDLNDYSVGWLKNVGHSPRHLNIDPSDQYLYASLNGEGKIAKIDLTTGKVLKKIATGNAPRSMVLSDDGQRLYVVNYSSNTVSKVRTSDMKVLQQVNVGANPIGITYDPQTREVWVACYSGTIMVFQDEV